MSGEAKLLQETLMRNQTKEFIINMDLATPLARNTAKRMKRGEAYLGVEDMNTLKKVAFSFPYPTALLLEPVQTLELARTAADKWIKDFTKQSPTSHAAHTVGYINFEDWGYSPVINHFTSDT